MDEHLPCVDAAFRAHQGRLIAVAYDILRSLEMAKDEAQNAFLQLAKKHCPSIENKEAWLVTVCRNGALKALARGRRDTPLTPTHVAALLDEGAEAATALGDNEHVRALLGHLDSLPEKQRDVLRLHYLGGLKLGQIAAALGAPANRIYQLHFEGLASLKRKLIRPARPRP